MTTKGIPLGLLHQETWARKAEDRGKSKQSRKRPLEEKESYKWIKSFKVNGDGIDKNISVVNICDREETIKWMLFTNTEVKSLDDAVEKIGWYVQREEWKMLYCLINKGKAPCKNPPTLNGWR